MLVGFIGLHKETEEIERFWCKNLFWTQATGLNRQLIKNGLSLIHQSPLDPSLPPSWNFASSNIFSKLKTKINYYIYLSKFFSFIHFSYLRIAQHVTFIFFDLIGRFVTMPYKFSSGNIANLSYLGDSFHGDIFRGRRKIFTEGELNFSTLFRKWSAIK